MERGPRAGEGSSRSRERKRRDRLAPSIQRAHRRVTWLLWASWLHAILLLALGIRLLLGEQGAWVTAVWCVPLAAAVPFLGRAAYRGNSFSAFILVLSVVVPPAVAFFTGSDMMLPLAGTLFLPVYMLGVRGATGLRGRRASARSRFRP